MHGAGRQRLGFEKHRLIAKLSLFPETTTSASK